jgi:hypothetical protein
LPPKELLVIIDPFSSNPFFLNEVFPHIEIQKSNDFESFQLPKVKIKNVNC